MQVEKLSISLDPDLGSAVRKAAEREDCSVSAWLAGAARARLRNLALRAALDDWQQEFGAFGEEERAHLRAELARRTKVAGPRPGGKKRSPRPGTEAP